MASDQATKPQRANVMVGAIVAVALLAALAALFVANRPHDPAAAEGLVAVVHDGDGATHSLPLSENAELVVSTSLGTNVVVVEDATVRVAEADCEGHDCVHQGRIAAPGRQVICLPHKLWIEVVAPGQGPGQLDTGIVAGQAEDVDVVAR